MNDKLVRLWQDAHLRAQHEDTIDIGDDYDLDPYTAIATMRYICKVLGVNEPPKECGHEYEPT